MYKQINTKLFEIAAKEIDDDVLVTLSKKTGISISTLVRLRSKSRDVTLHQLISIANALDVEVRIMGNTVSLLTESGEECIVTINDCCK